MTAPEKTDVLTDDEVVDSFKPTYYRNIVRCCICWALVCDTDERDHILKAHDGVPFERFA